MDKRTDKTQASLRILFLVGQLSNNGVTAHVMTLVKEMTRQGYQVSVASTQAHDNVGFELEQFERCGVQFIDIKFPDVLRFPIKAVPRLVQSLWGLYKVVCRFRPHVIHVHGLGLAPFAYLVRAIYGIPYVSTLHAENPKREKILSRFSVLKHFVGKVFGNRAIAVSQEIKESLLQHWGVQPEKICLIRHGVDDTHFRIPSHEERSLARSNFGLTSRDNVVCLVGRLWQLKGHDLLIEALSQLRVKGYRVIALCAGAGSWKEEIEAIAEKANVADEVRLLGYVDARNVLWASDVIVLPSRREAFALVIVEAMLCGVVPVRTPAGGAAEQIEDGHNGLIIPFDDPVALARCLELLFEDPARRASMAVLAETHAREHFTVARMTDQTLALYHTLTQPKSVL